MSKLKVKIIEAYYEPETDTVNWNVETPDGDVYPLVWPRARFGQQMNIRGVLSVNMIVAELPKFVGKEFIHEIKAVAKYEVKLAEHKDENQTVRKLRMPKMPKSKKASKRRHKH